MDVDRGRGPADGRTNVDDGFLPRQVEPASTERSSLAIVRSIVDDLGLLVRKEIELAREEIVAALVARGIGVGALAAAGVLALLAVVFLGLALSATFDLFMPEPVAHLLTALVFLGLAAGGALFARRQIKSAPVAEETRRTIKEDVEWAKAQLGR